jgi:general secretion pathway protein A
MSYSSYFGLREESFSITPDPEYLFLSEQHREALAHLLYGAGESGGFVLLTGEVGTGKTTVCRAFLEQLPEDVDVALILNPAMTATELLRSVCDELRIQVTEKERTIKCLVDRLNDYLLEAHAEGRRAVLMIDEAQDLHPKVLEQVRLLTNLETTKHKLLQIFLVGQPELRDLLRQEGLRQLDQRITARYHLRPFMRAETREYIRHRLAVAGIQRDLFTRAAMRRVHRLSGGIPRLINILCDRSLLGACVTRSPLVTKTIVDKAAREVRDTTRKPKPSGIRRIALAVAALVLAVSAAWMIPHRYREASLAWLSPYFPTSLARWLPLDQADTAMETSGTEIETAAEPEPEPETTSGPETGIESATVPEQPEESREEMPEEPTPDVTLASSDQDAPITQAVLADVTMDRKTAMRLLLRRWGVELGDLGAGDPCKRVRDYGLRCESGEGGWDALRQLNLPAVIDLKVGDQGSRYAVIGALDADSAILDLGEGNRRLNSTSLDEHWDGDYLALWQPPPVGGTMIGPGSSGEPVRWLRRLLSQVPGLGLEETSSGVFDRTLEDAVVRFQERQGLRADGIVGPKTLIRLDNVVGMPGIPTLLQTP